MDPTLVQLCVSVLCSGFDVVQEYELLSLVIYDGCCLSLDDTNLFSKSDLNVENDNVFIFSKFGADLINIYEVRSKTKWPFYVPTL